MPPSDIKLAIRTNAVAGTVSAFIAKLDGSDATPLGTIRIECLDGRDGPVFRAWLDAMRGCMVQLLLATTGIHVEGWSGDMDPADLEAIPQA